MKSMSFLGLFAAATCLWIGCESQPAPAPTPPATGAAKTPAATAKASASAATSAAAAASGSAAAGPRPAAKSQAKSLDDKPKAAAAGSAAPAASGAASAAPAASGAPVAAAGTDVAIPETTGMLTLPAGWKGTPEGKWVVMSKEGTESIAAFATSYGKGDDPTTHLGDVVSGAKLKNCEWNPTEKITIGKDELDAKVADGVCQDEDGAWVYIVYAMVQGGDINAFLLGGFDDKATEAQVEELKAILTSIHGKG
jgi:hypothetical protein